LARILSRFKLVAAAAGQLWHGKKKGSEYSYQLPGGGLSARMRDSSSSSSGSNNNCSVTKTTTTTRMGK